MTDFADTILAVVAGVFSLGYWAAANFFVWRAEREPVFAGQLAMRLSLALYLAIVIVFWQALYG